MLTFLGWWYGRGWLWAVRRIDARLKGINGYFAVGVLLKTWFSPWKQISTPTTFSNFFRNTADNLISRVIGSIVRGTMLFIALLWAIWIVVSGVILVVLWPAIPLATFILPVLAILEIGL